MTQKSQWLTTTKVYFLLIPVPHRLSSGTQADGALVLSLWKIARFGGRRTDTVNSMPGLQASVLT